MVIGLLSIIIVFFFLFCFFSGELTSEDVGVVLYFVILCMYSLLLFSLVLSYCACSSR